MTSQDAIANLKTLCHTCKIFPQCAYKKPECFKTIEMAISALEAQDAYDTNVGDTISRQQAIDALMEDFKRIPTNAIRAKTVIEQLPTAQPEHVRINLNEPIKVKLTDWGKEIYYHQYDRVNQIAGREICKPKFPKEDENGYTEFQLWWFMEIYGEHMGMTLPNVIEPLEVVYER